MIIISIKAFMKLPEIEKFIILRKVVRNEAKIIEVDPITFEIKEFEKVS